jgi:hypothetical protein
MVDEDNAPTREQRDAIIQRVRVGLTGLAAVFLLTLLAASIFSLLGQDEQHGVMANGAAAPNMAASEELPKEPLAELGVAPGGNLPKTTPAQARPGKSPAAGPAAPPVAAGHHEALPAPRG